MVVVEKFQKMLVGAGQPEILRAAQRDDNFKKQLSENVSEILQALFGIHFWIKYKEPAERLAKVLYQLVTTMSNIQTLGEEYTGIVQVDPSGKTLPKKYLQFLMILLDNYGEKVIMESLKNTEKTIENLPDNHPLRHQARVEIIKMANVLKTCLPIILKFHKSLFYLNGNYYDFAKRTCRIKYVLVRYWLKDRSSVFAFKLLGIITVIQSTLSLALTLLNYNNIGSERVYESTISTESVGCSDKCSLCLNVRKNTSVTPCGHLFCWSCIIPWLQEQPKCPLCRQVFQPSRVVFLQNFSNSS